MFTTYARILVAFYFRMPSVQTDILRATAVPPNIDLWDFTKIRQELADEENKPAPPPPPVPKKKGGLVPSVNQVRATSPKPPPRSTTARPSPPPPPIKQSTVVSNTNVSPTVPLQVNGTSPTKPPVRAATDADSPTAARSKSAANIMTHARSHSVSGTSSTSGSPSKTVVPLLNLPRAQLTTVPEGNDESKEIPLTPTTAQRQPDLGNGPMPKLNVNGSAYNGKNNNNNNNNNNNGIRHSIEVERGSYKSPPIDVESLRISAEMPLSPRTAEKLMREKEDKMKEERAEKSRAQMGMLFPGFVQWPLVHRLLFDSDPKMQKIF